MLTIIINILFKVCELSILALIELIFHFDDDETQLLVAFVFYT